MEGEPKVNKSEIKKYTENNRRWVLVLIPIVCLPLLWYGIVTVPGTPHKSFALFLGLAFLFSFLMQFTQGKSIRDRATKYYMKNPKIFLWSRRFSRFTSKILIIRLLLAFLGLAIVYLYVFLN